MSLSEQITQLKKQKWVDLHGLISCAMTHLSTAGPCTSISLLGRGSYSHVYKLVFTDGNQIAASISNHDEEDFNPRAKCSEIETMRFVRDSGLYPDIPVPRVYAFDTTFNNPAGAPYVLMDVVQGQTLHHVSDDNNDLRGLDALPREQQLSIVRSLAKLKASLLKPVPFDTIGSITTTAQGDHVVGPLMTITQRCLGGPFKSIEDLWRDRIEDSIIHALQEWSGEEKDDDLTFYLSDFHCTPQTFSEIVQLLSALIPHFTIPPPYTTLCLHHPDLALRNIFFDDTKITGVIDWGGAQILPLLLTARYPDDIMSTADEPFERPGHPDEDWHSVPNDWTSIGDRSQFPVAFRGKESEPFDFAPRARAMVGRFYLRTYFSACIAETTTDLSRATIFKDAPYYLKFHETVCGGWSAWVRHQAWIKETYWRLRLAGGQEGMLIIGPNVYKGSVQALVRDLGALEEEPPAEEPAKNDEFD
ncbi:hypothetical protein Hypma_001243 [Hypsizygus marmoreus]|uniref:Aminoglycoside phosphotransferase domain-containing protein n=1 Tax=Hypsizygus marmoreus TaxID=39966 RepID=A0A369JF97_HYPMA|nr:hypothetical protein Hypma_001243 [Hypsizygus marmoreus]